MHRIFNKGSKIMVKILEKIFDESYLGFKSFFKLIFNCFIFPYL